ncbi:MAG: hypothetical protein ACP6IS_00320 [Candidatus Asgardarchaeia archaeon]
MVSRNTVIGTIVAAVSPGIVFTILSVAFQEEIGVYQGHPIPQRVLLDTIFFSGSYASQFNTFIAIVVTWIITGIFVGETTRRLARGIIASIVGYFILVGYYLFLFEEIPSLWTYPVVLSFVILFISSAIFAEIRSLMRPKPFFVRLSEGGINVENEYKYPLNIPIECPNCHQKIYSNAEYCWNCQYHLVDAFKNFYAKSK